jgi:DNA-directed RNA polymerase subunit RPC12/RpoP
MTSIASGREQPCTRCGSKLVKAQWDERVNEREVQYLWRCRNCDNEFVTVVASEDERTPETAVTEPFFTSLVIE